MNKKFTRIFIAAALLLGAVNLRAGGGPDAYGYTWLASTDAGGPAFNWMDITGWSGAQQISGLADDNSVGPYALGWDFTYYWTNYNEVKIGSNGWVGFDNIGNIASCFPTVPTAGGSGDNFLAPYMSDLTFTSNFGAFPNVGEIWFWTNNTDSAIIQYVNVPWWKNSNGGTNPPDWQGSNTLQVILTSTDSSITYQYLDTDAANLYISGGCTNSIEIGMENVTGNIGLECYNNIVPGDSFVIKFDYPGTVTFQVPDVTPSWNANTDNKGQFFLVGSNVDMTTGIENVGNTDVTSSIAISGELLALDLTTVIWSDNSSLPSLAAGNAQTVTFPNQATISLSGQYYYNVETQNGDDINPSNNSNTSEVSAVEAIAGVYPLTYCTGNPPDGYLSWAGGNPNDGLAVYYYPPVTPAQLNSVDIWLAHDGNAATVPPHDCELEIWTADVNGNPGTMVTSETISAATMGDDAWMNVPISAQPSFNNEGFFVLWRQGGDSVSIGTEALGPISRRSYEILGGSVSEYRGNSNTEILLRANIDAAVAVDPVAGPVSELTVFPNPAQNVLNVRFEAAKAGVGEIMLMDLSGKVMKQSRWMVAAAGIQQLSWDTEKLAPGVYLLKVNMEGRPTTQKVVIAR